LSFAATQQFCKEGSKPTLAAIENHVIYSHVNVWLSL
jgi:hypothetical protein